MPQDVHGDDIGSPNDGRGQGKPGLACTCAACQAVRHWAAEELGRIFDATPLYGTREQP